VVDGFVAELDLTKLGFEGMNPQATDRPSYHPSTLLKIYLYGYLNRIQSSRRLERETQRNVELMWLTGRLMPDFKTIANFRKGNGPAIRGACRQFIVLCRQLNLFSQAVVAVDGGKFKAVNNRDRNFTSAKVQRRMEQIEASINRYMSTLDMADQEEAATPRSKSTKLKEKIAARLRLGRTPHPIVSRSSNPVAVGAPSGSAADRRQCTLWHRLGPERGLPGAGSGSDGNRFRQALAFRDRDGRGHGPVRAAGEITTAAGC